MNEAATTWALVVGVDQYDEAAWTLPGPVQDAIDFVDWLLELGVPRAQILTHVPDASAHRAELATRGVPIARATKSAIDTSIVQLAEVAAGAGTRLFVLWSGHGYWIDKANGGAFLAQDCTPKLWQTLGVQHYVKAFRSFNFRRTFLFFDACQTPAFGPTERERIPAQPWAGADVDALHIQPMANVWVCAASSQGQPGLQVDRSLFVQRLLEVLHPDADWTDAPLVRALHVNDDGRADVLLQSLVDQLVVPRVTADATAHGGVQTPTLVAVWGEAAAPIFSLRDHVAKPRELRLNASISKVEAFEKPVAASWVPDALAFLSLLIVVREHHYRSDAFAELVSVHLASFDDEPGAAGGAAVEWRALRLALVELNACARTLLARYHQVSLPESQSGSAASAADQLEHLLQQSDQLADKLAAGGRSRAEMAGRIAEQAIDATVTLRCALEAAFSAAALRADPDLEVVGHRGRDAVRLWAAATDTHRLWQKVAPLVAGREQRPDLSTGPARTLVRRMGSWGAPVRGDTDTSALDDALGAINDALDLSTLQPVVIQLGSMSNEIATLVSTSVTASLSRAAPRVAKGTP